MAPSAPPSQLLTARLSWQFATDDFVEPTAKSKASRNDPNTITGLVEGILIPRGRFCDLPSLSMG